MVVVGQGETIPYTDGEVCDLDSVLAVIEVKKNLYTSDLAEGYDNLLSVMDLTNSVVPRHINENVCRRFQAITRRPLSNDIDLMPAQERLLYHLLVVEMARPVRILLGYHGFRSERTLRKGSPRICGLGRWKTWIWAVEPAASDHESAVCSRKGERNAMGVSVGCRRDMAAAVVNGRTADGAPPVGGPVGASLRPRNRVLRCVRR
jgi:hypothetical protein